MFAADETYMRLALALAETARAYGEIPVGAVLVSPAGQVVGRGFNRTLTGNDPSAHAEIAALRDAGARSGNYRLPGLTMYVTLEPCCMCAGALVHARVRRLCYAAADPRTGACGSVFSVLTDPRHNHHVAITAGVLAAPCAELLREFFALRRRQLKDLHPDEPIGRFLRRRGSPRL